MSCFHPLSGDTSKDACSSNRNRSGFRAFTQSEAGRPPARLSLNLDPVDELSSGGVFFLDQAQGGGGPCRYPHRAAPLATRCYLAPPGNTSESGRRGLFLSAFWRRPGCNDPTIPRRGLPSRPIRFIRPGLSDRSVRRRGNTVIIWCRRRRLAVSHPVSPPSLHPLPPSPRRWHRFRLARAGRYALLLLSPSGHPRFQSRRWA